MPEMTMFGASALISSEYDPGGVEACVWTVRIELLAVVVFGEKVAVAPAGSPNAQRSVTFPA